MPTANPGGVHKRMLFITNALANATASSVNPKTFQQIADEFNTGKVWGQIAKENGVKLGSIISGIKRSNKAIQTQKRNDNRPTGGSGHVRCAQGKTGQTFPVRRIQKPRQRPRAAQIVQALEQEYVSVVCNIWRYFFTICDFDGLVLADILYAANLGQAVPYTRSRSWR